MTNTGADPNGDELQLSEDKLLHCKHTGRSCLRTGYEHCARGSYPPPCERQLYSPHLRPGSTDGRYGGQGGLGICLDVEDGCQDPALMDSTTADTLILEQLADWRRPTSLHDRRASGEARSYPCCTNSWNAAMEATVSRGSFWIRFVPRCGKTL